MRPYVPPRAARRNRNHAGNAPEYPRILLAHQVRCMLEDRLLEEWFQGRFRRQGYGSGFNLRVTEG